MGIAPDGEGRGAATEATFHNEAIDGIRAALIGRGARCDVNLIHWYVDEELRRIERARDDSPQNPLRWRREWLLLNTQPRRPAVAWLGERLIGLGERLQSWALPATHQVLPE